MKWLAECSAAALGEALRTAAPELTGYPVTMSPGAGQADPLWHSSTAILGETCSS